MANNQTITRSVSSVLIDIVLNQVFQNIYEKQLIEDSLTLSELTDIGVLPAEIVNDVSTLEGKEAIAEATLALSGV